MKVRFFLGKMKVRLKAPLVNFKCVRAGSESSQKKKIRTPPLVNDESFWLRRKLINPYSKFGIHFTRKKKKFGIHFILFPGLIS